MKTYTEKQLQIALGILSGRTTERNLTPQRRAEFLTGDWLQSRTWEGMQARAEGIVTRLLLGDATVAPRGITGFAAGNPTETPEVKKSTDARSPRVLLRHPGETSYHDNSYWMPIPGNTRGNGIWMFPGQCIVLMDETTADLLMTVPTYEEIVEDVMSPQQSKSSAPAEGYRKRKGVEVGCREGLCDLCYEPIPTASPETIADVLGAIDDNNPLAKALEEAAPFPSHIEMENGTVIRAVGNNPNPIRGMTVNGPVMYDDDFPASVSDEEWAAARRAVESLKVKFEKADSTPTQHRGVMEASVRKWLEKRYAPEVSMSVGQAPWNRDKISRQTRAAKLAELQERYEKLSNERKLYLLQRFEGEMRQIDEEREL